MKNKKLLILIAVFAVFALAISACAGAEGAQGPEGPPGPQGEPGPEGPQGPAGEAAMMSAADLSCTECHNDTALITGKKVPWEASVHGSGTAAAYAGGRGGCAACHSGAAFSQMVADGATPDTWEGSTADVTHQDCRTCHQIHTSYTGDDWALETNAAVALYAFEDATFDGGQGNLCANCHQPRRAIDAADADGNIEVTSTHWGPHHGPQTAMLLGMGGAGEVDGSASAHYSLVEDTCVACHLGENDNHTFLPTVGACQDCHQDIEDFDFSGLQTEVAEDLEELAAALEAAGLWDGEADHPIVGVYPAAQAEALWNYIFISHEDSSMGVHNPAYTRALLEASLAAFP
ncbi:MAG TPA: cytochrome c3 family protein [Anaerolineales bacterium]|nr:cytochrome c3 family protein [Anaerolineales bacterium]